jgi:hypothetical protein
LPLLESGEVFLAPQGAQTRAQTIDLQAAYPCPCSRRGRLSPITLTEAFGCDYCQQIFVAKQAGQRLAQLASHSPEQRMWYWTGQQWRLDRTLINRRYWLLSLILLAISLPLLLVWTHAPDGIRALLQLLAVMVLMLSVLAGIWLAVRR